ncbi:cytochrome ubiquinol oxidase subunit II [Paenibacillus rhizovicinus]|uniref:Quinol oxidase subunit 2 n=1 Tax=Paenibacillus rhizovicinus TaxID=2704463 RepID=A0A6C0NUV1_9BACL|nr:COX aromatic rich motif-containing protein [Paenibacillus rhizovicinus]QHW29891.1 cytochrome ubiquinol oxidase subunit II [Paenibacillus rhizovicinus]
MKKRSKLRGLMLLITGLLTTVLLSGCDGKFVVFDPQGPVAQTQYRLIILSAILCAIVVIPVLAITVFIVLRYRDKPGNTAPYKPHWDDSKVLEILWWGIPIVIIAILGGYTARDTYALARTPKTAVTDVKPIEIQVTSLDWKWLFQYPDQNIATVNYVHIPAGVQVHFELTSDAPMNSFWIPQLGGQEYTMPGMAMSLWLQADKTGEYYGTGANFSGKEFAHMRFNVVSESQADFNKWVDSVKSSSNELTEAGYNELAIPGKSDEQSFSSYPPELFDSIVKKNGGHHMDMDMDENKDDKVDTDEQKSDAKDNTHNMDDMSDMDMSNMDMTNDNSSEMNHNHQ